MEVVLFDEPSHTYTDVETGKNFISVTTLIKKYTPEFDRAYWSMYKAVQAVMEARGEWVKYKKKCGGWENVVTYLTQIDTEFPHWDLVRAKRQDFLDIWAEKARVAAENGSAFHNKKEQETLDSPSAEGIEGFKDRDIIAQPVFEGDEIYAELLIYDRKLGVAGKADWVKRCGKVIDINDYKTSKDVSSTAFMNETMFPPLSHLPNANFYKFSLQLSVYMFMLERAGYQVGELSVEHIDKVTHESLGMIPVNYMRDEVVQMLRHHRDEQP